MLDDLSVTLTLKMIDQMCAANAPRSAYLSKVVNTLTPAQAREWYSEDVGECVSVCVCVCQAKNFETHFETHTLTNRDQSFEIRLIYSPLPFVLLVSVGKVLRSAPNVPDRSELFLTTKIHPRHFGRTQTLDVFSNSLVCVPAS